MSDLFQTDVPVGYIESVVRVMTIANWHTYQVLTKCSERMRDMLNGQLAFAAKHARIWWGVSVGDRKYGVPRIEHLRQSNQRSGKYASTPARSPDPAAGSLRSTSVKYGNKSTCRNRALCNTV
jgi:protein gp37